MGVCCEKICKVYFIKKIRKIKNFEVGQIYSMKIISFYYIQTNWIIGTPKHQNIKTWFYQLLKVIPLGTISVRGMKIWHGFCNLPRPTVQGDTYVLGQIWTLISLALMTWQKSYFIQNYSTIMYTDPINFLLIASLLSCNNDTKGWQGQ